MPSPFPGMDPYLEGDLWTTFHAQFVPQIARALTARIKPKYLAFAQKAMLVCDAEDLGIVLQRFKPDVVVQKQSGTTPASRNGLQLLDAPLQLRNRLPVEYPHFWVEIRDVAKRRLVTAIEFMSPANKKGTGRKKYLRKRDHLLESSSHLLEIDLLRKGLRIPLEEDLPEAPYFVLLSRANRRPIVDVWPIQLDQVLPTVPVPLLRKDGDAPLELQKTFAEVYDACGYDVAIDYRQPPDVPLTPQQKTWSDQLLRKNGKRKKE